MLLLRHGRTDWNDEGRVQGQLDIELNASGRRELRATAQALRGFAIDQVWTSPCRRALESASIVAELLGLRATLFQDARLQEVDTGDWTGQTYEALRKDIAWQVYLSDPDATTSTRGMTIRR